MTDIMFLCWCWPRKAQCDKRGTARVLELPRTASKVDQEEEEEEGGEERRGDFPRNPRN